MVAEKESVFSRDKASDRIATPKRSALSIHEQHKMTSAGCIHKYTHTHAHTYTKYIKFSEKNLKSHQIRETNSSH